MPEFEAGELRTATIPMLNPTSKPFAYTGVVYMGTGLAVMSEVDFSLAAGQEALVSFDITMPEIAGEYPVYIGVFSGGNNIYPQEVEATLTAHPGIHAALVLGLDHPDLGSELVAVIEPEGSAFDREALERHLAAHLPRYKHPRRIWLCRKMPMTRSGKVAAGTLRQWIADDNDDLERLD